MHSPSLPSNTRYGFGHNTSLAGLPLIGGRLRKTAGVSKFIFALPFDKTAVSDVPMRCQNHWSDQGSNVAGQPQPVKSD